MAITDWSDPALQVGYAFDTAGISGATLADKSPNGNDGTITGTEQISGKIGAATSFNTSGHIVSAFRPATGTKSYTFWLKPTTTAGPITVMDSGTKVVFGGGFRVYIEFGYLYLEVTNSSFQAASYSNNQIQVNDNAWHFVTIAYNGGTGAIEIDVDDSQDSYTLGISESAHSADLTIGGYYDGNNYTDQYDGAIDDLRVFDVFLSAQDRLDIQALAAGGGSEPEATAVARVTGWRRLRVVLTGAPDSLEDVELLASSAVIRTRTGSYQYIAVTVPMTAEMTTAINDRPNGDLELIFGEYAPGGEFTETTLATLSENYSLRTDIGASSRTLTLSGYNTGDGGTGSDTETLEGLSYLATDSAGTHVRGKFNPVIQLGDTLNIPGNGSITVDSLAFMINGSRIFYELGGS